MDQSPDAVRPTTDLLITGIPRSGTTLATAIVDGLKDSLALSEPQVHVDLMASCPDETALYAGIVRVQKELRHQILKGFPVMDRRRPDGRPLTDYYPRDKGAVASLRTERPIARPNLPTDFLLATKHNALYTAILPEIIEAEQFTVLIITRNPVDVLLAWQGLPIPVSSARLPAGERYWPELAKAAGSPHTLLEKQADLLELFFARYHRFGREKVARLARYEDILDRPEIISDLLRREAMGPVFIRRPKTRAGSGAFHIAELVRERVPSSRLLYPEGE